ncbi:MAG: hypothetical protein H8F28_18345 [Fibrella sp.]|nr:hypothetical protein [Armatimonadota bacterium]
MATIWQKRLDSGWTPPQGSGFPWDQVRLSLAALLPGMRSAQKWVERVTVERNVSRLAPAPPVLTETRAARVTLILAGNTPLLAWSPLCACLLAGVGIMRVKLSRDETVWTRLFVESLREADAKLAERIELHDFPGEDERTYALLTNADAVIAYGSDAAIDALRGQTPKSVPFFDYGHAVSVGLAEQHTIFDLQACAGFATDCLMYDQQGCLSPHILYITGSLRHPTGVRNVEDLSLGGRMRHKMQEQSSRLPPPVAGSAARIREARDIALFSGRIVHGDDTLRWTVISSLETIPYPPPVGHGVLTVSPVESAAQLRELLQPVWGIVSCAGVAGELSPEWEAVLREAGVSRICQPGEMQTPPLDWQNGNRDLLAELLQITELSVAR